MTKRSSMRAIAEELGLSVPTVSRALGGYTDISAATRARVAETAKRLGYEPNSAGRMLASGKSGFVGLVLPVGGQQLLDAYLGAIVAGLSEGLAARDLQLMIATVPEGAASVDTLRRLVNARRVDGLVLTRVTPEDERIAFLQDRKLPFVALGRQRAELPAHPLLDVESEAAFDEALHRLVGLGHRHVGYVSITDDFSFVRHRDEAVASAAAKLGLKISQCASARADERARRRDIAAMLSAPERPTAILAIVDEIALTVLAVAAGLGLSVPADLSVIGFDDLSAAAYASPPLSTFNPSTRQIGHQAGTMLADLLAGQGETTPQILRRAEFVARGSHGPAPQ